MFYNLTANLTKYAPSVVVIIHFNNDMMRITIHGQYKGDMGSFRAIQYDKIQ